MQRHCLALLQIITEFCCGINPENIDSQLFIPNTTNIVIMVNTSRYLERLRKPLMFRSPRNRGEERLLFTIKDVKLVEIFPAPTHSRGKSHIPVDPALPC